MSSLRAALLLGLVLVAAAPLGARAEEDSAPAYLHLEYRVVTTNETVGEGVERKAPLVPRTEGTLRVVLGPRRVEIVAEEEGGRTVRTVLDHADGRVLRVDADGSYRESPLLAQVGFLDREMTNLAQLGGALAAAGLDEASMRPREVSIRFGWRSEDDDAQIRPAPEEGAVVFRDAAEELARWTPSPETLDEAQRASLQRFLHQACRLHPDVRDAIVAEGRAPASLRFRWHDLGARSTSELTLLGAERGGAEGLLRLERRVFDDADPLARTAQRVLVPTDEDLAARLTREDFLRLAREAHADARFADAALLLLECGLQTGGSVTEELRAVRADDAATPHVGPLFEALARRDPAEQLAALDALDRAQFSRPHLIDVFRANALAATKGPDAGRDAMLAALDRAPWLTGAWKDLGGMYLAGFDARRAWLAWEAGRRAGPDHPMWAAVTQYEERLRKKYAELL